MPVVQDSFRFRPVWVWSAAILREDKVFNRAASLWRRAVIHQEVAFRIHICVHRKTDRHGGRGIEIDAAADGVENFEILGGPQMKVLSAGHVNDIDFDHRRGLVEGDQFS